MIRHNLLLIYRNFLRFRSTFFINLIGLSSGLACTLLIYLWITDELKVDKFLDNDDRIFQVMQNTERMNAIETMEATPGLLSKSMKEEIPEVEYSVSIIPPTFNSSKGIISVGDIHIKTAGQYASEDFFDIFSYTLIQGERNKVLSDINGVVISKNLALRLFKTIENAVGKTVEWNAQDIKVVGFVSGIYEAPPANATNQFDVVLNFEKFAEMNPSSGWGNSGPRTYLLLKKDVSLKALNEKIAGFIKSKDAESKSTLFLQRYSERYLHGYYENGIPAGGRIEYIKLFSIIGVFILIIACINFMNLLTAKSFTKAKEVGIKKTFGVERITLMWQFLTESMLMSFLALALAILFSDLLITPFNYITGKNLNLTFDWPLALSALSIAVFTGLFSGIYPALYLSRFRATEVLKGKMFVVSGEGMARRGLVIFQFAISVILIISVVVVNIQLKFIQNKNLGYKRDHVIYFETPGMTSAFLSEIKGVSGVINAGGGRLVAGGALGGTNDLHWEGKSPDDMTFFTNLWVCYGLIETLDMKMFEGRTFSDDFGSHDQIIFNEEAIKGMGLKDPIGKKVKFRGEERQIVGVIKDFHFESLYEKVKPCVLLVAPIEYAPNVSVKIQAGTEHETLQHLQNLYKSHYPGQTFDFKFMEDDYQRLYSSEQKVAGLTKYFAGLAILISCLGLFGLAAFTAEKRTKEIGIRKVLGSSVFSIVRLLCGDFTKIVAVSLLFSIPVSYFLAYNWLQDFAFKAQIEWWYFVGAGVSALFVAWLTVATQAIKAARLNPTQCLKDE